MTNEENVARKLSAPAQEYIDDFREQDARTPSDFVYLKRQVLKKGMMSAAWDIEEAAIRDFDAYIEHSGGVALSALHWDVAKDWLGALLEMEEENLMEDLSYFDSEGTTSETLGKINLVRAMLDLPEVEIRRNFPYSATWHMPDGRWGWAEPRDVLFEVGKPDPDPAELTEIFKRYNTHGYDGYESRFCEGRLEDQQ